MRFMQLESPLLKAHWKKGNIRSVVGVASRPHAGVESACDKSREKSGPYHNYSEV